MNIKSISCVALFILFFTHSYCQGGETGSGHKNYSVTTQEPKYPGGDEALYAFLSKNIVYPTKAEQQGMETDVNVSITIEADGTVKEAMAMNNPGNGFKEEAERVAKLLVFEPATISGRAIRSSMILPVLFRMKTPTPSPSPKE